MDEFANDKGKLFDLLSINPIDRTDNIIKTIEFLLNNLSFFKKFNKLKITVGICKNLRMAIVESEKEIFAYGDKPCNFYIILQGQVKILVPVTESNIISDPQHKVRMREGALLKPGTGFGELSLLSNKPRAATAITVEKTVLLVCDKKTYNENVKEQEKYRLDKKVQYLKNHVLTGVDSGKAMKLSYFFKEIVFKKGKSLFEEDDPLTHLYLIRKGRVWVSLKAKEEIDHKTRSQGCPAIKAIFTCFTWFVSWYIRIC